MRDDPKFLMMGPGYSVEGETMAEIKSQLAESMIERVADAISLVFAAEQERLVDAAMAADGSLTGIADEVMLKCARAAIEAMREPTEAMIDAGQNEVNLLENPDPPNAFEFLTVDEITGIWTEMIDASLATPLPGRGR